ncbi:MAG: sulfurtransferase-like selenium metabolism protein YedF [Nitrospirae bacterium]|nr:sulfurtransferase-like selenium metabolism protein YedF [Nitrospirota bacterium]
MRIDARGLGCPKPVLLADEALKEIEEGSVEVLVDNEASVKNLQRFARKNGYYSEVQENSDHWQVKIIKGYSCELPEDKEERKGDKKILMIIGTDTMGKEEDLGRILMKGFLETIKVSKEIPHTMFFLNAGVKLTTENEETIPVLKELEALGVEIFSCGTCLKYYNLEGELKVGFRGSTNQIVDGIMDFDKVVWI